MSSPHNIMELLSCHALLARNKDVFFFPTQAKICLFFPRQQPKRRGKKRQRISQPRRLKES
jgi:hypothetical protein